MHVNATKTGPLAAAEYSVFLMRSTPGKCWSTSELTLMLQEAGFASVTCRPHGCGPVRGDRPEILSALSGAECATELTARYLGYQLAVAGGSPEQARITIIRCRTDGGSQSFVVGTHSGGSDVKDAETLITERDLLGKVAGRLAVGSQNNRVPANFAGWQVRPGACCGQVTDTRLPASGGRVAAGEHFRTPGGREAR